MRPRRQNSHNSKGLCRALDHADADVINIVKTSFQQNVTDNHQEANINCKNQSSLANKNEKKKNALVKIQISFYLLYCL